MSVRILDYDEMDTIIDKWYSTDEVLPPIGVEVNVYCPKKRAKVTALTRFIPYEGADRYYWDNAYPGKGNTHLSSSVTKWRRMPDAPIEGENES